MLTREQVLSAEPGTNLNVMVAEHVFGWKRIEGPEHDYDCPVEHREVLIPPNMSKAHAYAMMPPRGRVELSYFVNRHWSKDIAAAWQVFTRFEMPNIQKLFDADGNDYYVCEIGTHRARGATAPEAICKAALLAVLGL